MNLQKSHIILGSSGHANVVIETAEKLNISIRYYADKKPNVFNFFELEYFGCESDINFKGWKQELQFILGIGNNHLRAKAGALIIEKKESLLNIIHPNASITKYIKIGKGNFIANNVVINTNTSIGNFCICNTSSIIEHDCKIGNAVHIGPGTIITGNVSLGDYTFVGANATIKPGIKIGKNVIIGAGSVVTKNINDNETYVGNPAKFLKVNE